MCGTQRKYKVREATQEVRVFSLGEQSLAGFKQGSVSSALIMRLGNILTLQVFKCKDKTDVSFYLDVSD